MALPVIFQPGTAAILAVSPGAVVPIVAIYAANTMVRVAAQRAIQSVVSSGVEEELAVIADRLKAHNEAIPAGEAGIADVVYNKECGIRDATLEINVVPPDESEVYSSSWTAYT